MEPQPSIEERRKEVIARVPLYTPLMVDINLLIHTDSKSRLIDPEEMIALEKSVKLDPDFMKARPPIVNAFPGREWIIIGGDKRTLAAENVGYKQIPVIFVKVDPTKENAWNKKDNMHNGKWDEVNLSKELIVLRDEKYNLDSMGINPTTLVETMNLGGKKLSHKDDPNYKGTTPRRGPKVKVAEGAELECPNCHTKFSYGVGVKVEPPQENGEE